MIGRGATACAVREVWVVVAREILNRADLPVGDQMPKFADHDRHVAACMAEGGFIATARGQNPGEVVILRPTYADPAAKAPRRRRSLRGGRR